MVGHKGNNGEKGRNMRKLEEVDEAATKEVLKMKAEEREMGSGGSNDFFS